MAFQKFSAPIVKIAKLNEIFSPAWLSHFFPKNSNAKWPHHITNNDEDSIKLLKAFLYNRFHTTNVGPLTYLFSIEVVSTRVLSTVKANILLTFFLTLVNA